MYPRTEYEMTEDDLKTLMDAMKPVPMIALQCGAPSSQQENANNAWANLGAKMGFDGETVRPIDGKGTRWFTAIPSETESARKERMEKEKEENRKQEINRLEEEISERQGRLHNLRYGA